MNCIVLLNTKSTPAINRAKISDVIITSTALFCKSFHEGQVTLCTSSVYESLKYSFIFFIFPTISAREERLELPTPGFGDQCSTN